MATVQSAAGIGPDQIVARIERLPMSSWHLRVRLIVGIATFFDGFDTLAIAYVLPVVAPLWHLTPAQIGLLLSASFFGQIIAALSFGWIAERFGRVPTIMWSTLIYSVMSLACAFAWDYNSLLVMRTVQGIGIGAEVPIAITYIAELSRTQGRGRFLLLYEIVFPIGLVAAVLVGIWVVPHLGWRWLFAIGAAPALLAFLMQRLLPESPRWLAARGRLAEADTVMTRIESAVTEATGAALPPPQVIAKAQVRALSLADLFGPLYLRRTLVAWAIWGCCFFCNFGLAVWLPTVYRSVLGLSVTEALAYTLVTQMVGLIGTLTCALLMDHFKRRLWFSGAFVGAAAFFLAVFAARLDSAGAILITSSAAFFFISLISIGVYLYTPEIYPTRARAIGIASSACVARTASFIGPNVVGALMAASGLGSVFLTFGLVAICGAAIAGLFAHETRFRVLEEISP